MGKFRFWPHLQILNKLAKDRHTSLFWCKASGKEKQFYNQILDDPSQAYFGRSLIIYWLLNRTQTICTAKKLGIPSPLLRFAEPVPVA